MKDELIGGIHWSGHRPVVGPVIVQNVPRPPTQLVDRFRDFFIPDICDRVGQLYTMDSSIHSLYQPARPLVGIALTVKTPRSENSSIHRAMNMVQPGDVLVIDARGDTESCGSGAGSLMAPISRGLEGVVIDGAWRDISELEAIGFPIYGKGVTAFSSPKTRPGEINVPVCCGGVIVHPGDIIVCGQDGAVVIPRKHAELVADSLQEHTLKSSLEEWDLERIKRNAKRRDELFEELFQERGGSYIDWNNH